VPPVGIYEHKFKQSSHGHGTKQRRQPTPARGSGEKDQAQHREEDAAGVAMDLKLIAQPIKHPAKKQPFSCFAETQQVDFGKGTNRDDVSFYKKLARFEKAQRLNLPVSEYERLLRQHRSGKFVVTFNESPSQTPQTKKRPTGDDVAVAELHLASSPSSPSRMEGVSEA